MRDETSSSQIDPFSVRNQSKAIQAHLVVIDGPMLSVGFSRGAGDVWGPIAAAGTMDNHDGADGTRLLPLPREAESGRGEHFCTLW